MHFALQIISLFQSFNQSDHNPTTVIATVLFCQMNEVFSISIFVSLTETNVIMRKINFHDNHSES